MRPRRPTASMREVMTVSDAADATLIRQPATEARTNDLTWFAGRRRSDHVANELNALVHSR